MIKVGEINFIEEIASDDKSAANIGSGLLNVYATPSMVALMEKCASEGLQKYLGPEESSVGGMINIKHTKPTKIGDKVTCTAEVVEVKGSKVVFKVTAKDSSGTIGFGDHVRFIVNSKEFMGQVS